MKRKIYTAKCSMTGHVEHRHAFNSAAKACEELLQHYARATGLTGDWLRIEGTMKKDGHLAVSGTRVWRHTASGQKYKAIINLEK